MIKLLRNRLNRPQARSRIRAFSFFFFVIASSAFYLYPFSYIYAALSCSVTTQASCNSSGFTTILRMSGSTNAHAELPSQSNANYANNVVCCSNSPSGIGNSCSGNFQSVVRISGATNGTTQESTVNTYGTNVCLSDTTGNDTVTVAYQNTNCAGYDTTLLSLSSSDNAHVGDGSAYARKVCATIVPQTISFDLDTDTNASTENGPTYSVPLGTITPSSVVHSDGSTINSIILEGDTNASGGMVVTVQNTNGSSGLKSASVPADAIPSTTSSMSAGTANYGLCVATSGLTGFSRAASTPDYSSGTCSLVASNNAVKALSTTPVDIVNSAGAPVSGGHAEVIVNAAISTITPSHADYADTLTFIATGTF